MTVELANPPFGGAVGGGKPPVRPHSLTLRSLDEQPDRVGGRLETVELGGTPADLGGCFVGAEHTSLRVLIGELGMRTFRAHGRGNRVTCRTGRLAHGALTRRVTTRA